MIRLWRNARPINQTTIRSQSAERPAKAGKPVTEGILAMALTFLCPNREPPSSSATHGKRSGAAAGYGSALRSRQFMIRSRPAERANADRLDEFRDALSTGLAAARGGGLRMSPARTPPFRPLRELADTGRCNDRPHGTPDCSEEEAGGCSLCGSVRVCQEPALSPPNPVSDRGVGAKYVPLETLWLSASAHSLQRSEIG